MSDNPSGGFWTSLPGVLTGAAALVTAIGGLVAMLSGGSAPASDTPPIRPQTTTQTGETLPSREPRTAPEPPTDVAGETGERPRDVFTLRATIDDPDGFTNVRRRKTAASEIVARVPRGEVFRTYPQQGEWWQVLTRDGQIGYMAASRIKILPAR